MITVYGRVTEMEPSAPPGPYEPPVVPPEEIGTEAWALAQELRTRGTGVARGVGRPIAVRSGTTLQKDIVHPMREVVRRGETVQDGEATLESREVETEAVEGREGEAPVESWMHVHIVLDPPHSGEIEINAPGFAVSAMLAVGGRARVMLSAS